MSVSYTAYVVYGVIVNKDWLYTETKHRGCSHDEVPKARFCAECGKPMYRIERDLELEMGESKKLSFFASTYEDEEVVLGFSLASIDDDGDGAKSVRTPTTAQKTEIEEYCKKLEIELRPNDLKQHLVLYCCY